jgi:hypothetical protein
MSMSMQPPAIVTDASKYLATNKYIFSIETELAHASLEPWEEIQSKFASNLNG